MTSLAVKSCTIAWLPVINNTVLIMLTIRARARARANVNIVRVF